MVLNKEANTPGIKRLSPYFLAKVINHHNQVTCFSQNYTLYRDMSARIMMMLEKLTLETTIYAIDEVFLKVTDIDTSESYLPFSQRVRATVRQTTGLTCGIGISQTLTLTKLANHAEKMWPAICGVVDLSQRERQRKLMALLPVNEAWGIGRKLSERLNTMGIKTV